MPNNTSVDIQHIRLLISIVNFRVPELTIACLHSLETELSGFSDAKVVVVDNDSGDDSVSVVQRAIDDNNWSHWVSVLTSEKNGGYAFGNNLAIRPTLQNVNPPDFYFILNPDTEVRPGCITALIRFMVKNPTIGITGPSLEDNSGKELNIAFRFPSALGEIESTARLGLLSTLLRPWAVARNMGINPEKVDWIPGGAMMIRREAFLSAGLMDENFFLFYEETDFCLQAKRHGWECWYNPQARVMDICGKSREKLDGIQPSRKPSYWFASRRYYFQKNHRRQGAYLADAAWILGTLLHRVKCFITLKPSDEPKNVLRDFFSYCFNKQA